MMDDKKINPHQVRPGHERFNNHKAPGGKVYLPKFQAKGFMFFSRSMFKTATQAEDHAVRVIERWRRLYDAWLVFEAKKALEVSG